MATNVFDLIAQRKADFDPFSDISTKELLDLLDERYLDDEDIRRMLVMIGEAL